MPYDRGAYERLRNGTFGKTGQTPAPPPDAAEAETAENFTLQSPEENPPDGKMNSLERLAKRRTQALGILARWKSSAVARNQTNAVKDCNLIADLIHDLMPWDLPPGV